MLKYAESPLVEAVCEAKFLPIGDEDATIVDIMDIDGLSRDYVFQDYQDVSHFLFRNPLVASKLLEAHQYIRLVWGRDAIVKLDVLYDPEDSDGNRLLAYIQTSESAKQALSSLDRFDGLWWFQHSQGIINKLSFDVKCI